MLLEVAYQKTL